MRGKCQKCGECCKLPVSLPVRGEHISEPERMFLKVKGASFKMMPDGEWAYLPSRCLHLTEDNLCAIYEDRPEICRNHWCD